MSYVGSNTPATDILGGRPRFFYGLRRTDQGDLYLVKVDQLTGTDSVFINNPGDQTGNLLTFDEGVDFFEGRDVYHNLIDTNLNYEQFRWDDISINYYLDPTSGEFVARVNQAYTYSSNP